MKVELQLDSEFEMASDESHKFISTASPETFTFDTKIDELASKLRVSRFLSRFIGHFPQIQISCSKGRHKGFF